MTVSSPKPEELEDPNYDYIKAFNRGSVEFNLEQLGAYYTGHCTAPPSNLGGDCLVDSDCDDIDGDGNCTKPFFEFAPPVTATNLCSDYAGFVVPLKEPAPGLLKKASTGIKTKAFASADPVTGKVRNKDADGIKLVCLPAP